MHQMFVQWYNTVATLHPPALLLQLLNTLHFQVICCALYWHLQILPKPQLHITVVLLLTVFDSVLCQTNVTKLHYLL